MRRTIVALFVGRKCLLALVSIDARYRGVPWDTCKQSIVFYSFVNAIETVRINGAASTTIGSMVAQAISHDHIQ